MLFLPIQPRAVYKRAISDHFPIALASLCFLNWNILLNKIDMHDIFSKRSLTLPESGGVPNCIVLFCKNHLSFPIPDLQLNPPGLFACFGKPGTQLYGNHLSIVYVYFKDIILVLRFLISFLHQVSKYGRNLSEQLPLPS